MKARMPVPSRPERTLGQSAVHAVLWTASQRWMVRITGFITIAILTRMLTPADFGTVAIVTAILPLMYLIADLGFSTYIVQAREADQRMLSTAFWFTSSAGLLLAGAFVCAAPLVDMVFNVDGAGDVMWGLAPTVLLVTVTTVPMSLLRRRMAFRSLAMQSLIASLVGQAIAIVMALSGFGVWALIAQTLVNQLVASVYAWIVARWRPSLKFDRTEFKAMTAFGSKVVGVELIATGRLLAENAIITSALGVSALGYINIAQRLVQVAQDVTAAAILPVSTVVFAQVRENPDRLRSIYVRSLGLTYSAIIPVMILLAATSPILIPVLFGSQWLESVAPAQILAVVSIFVMGAMLDHGLFYGAGQPGRWFIYATVIDGLTIVTALFTAPHGLVVWALGFFGVAIVATVIRWPLVAALLRMGWTEIARVFGRTMGTGAVTALLTVAASYAVSGMVPILQLVILAAVVVTTHVAAMYLFTRAILKEGLSHILRLRRPRRPTRAETPHGEGELR